jgi:hypothetical protein
VTRRIEVVTLLSLLFACGRPAAASPPPGGPLGPLAVDALCVTSGAAEPHGMARFAVSAPTFRAVSTSASNTRAELRFTYLGPTATTRALGSGAIRQQLGLKLRAQDPCNLVYAMWRLEPESRLVVQVKRNPGARTSAECGNKGYATVKPLLSAQVPPIAVGSSHVLSAELHGSTLDVKADGILVWKGDLGADALAIDGPVGVRSDNVHFEAELATPTGGARVACEKAGEAE